MTPRIGLAQMNSRGSFEDNRIQALDWVKQAAEEKLAIVAFPEMFLYLGDSKEEKIKIATSLEGSLVQQFQEAAQQYQISILLGSIYEEIPDDPARLYNTSVFINRDGEILGTYRKIHLCDIDSPEIRNIESRHIKAGDQVVVFDHEVGRIGLSICYDMRFPGLYQHIAGQGAQIIFAPSAFFLETGKDHWFPLLRARAIENQVFIAAPAQCGWHYGNRFSYGHSTLINPWGTVLAAAPNYPDLISSRVDLEYLGKVRQNMPVHKHQRYDCYRMGD